MQEIIPSYGESLIENAALAEAVRQRTRTVLRLSVQSANTSREMMVGEAIFVDACAGCHQTSGEAVPRAFTPLKGNAVVQSQDPLNVIRVILQGACTATTDARPTPFTMPAYAWKLGDNQVAAVATYVRNTWGNVASPVKPAQVKALRGKLGHEPVADPP